MTFGRSVRAWRTRSRDWGRFTNRIAGKDRTKSPPFDLPESLNYSDVRGQKLAETLEAGPFLLTVMRRVYLDNNASTPLAPEAFEAMNPYWLGDFGNASSIHWYGQRARSAVEDARDRVARLINAQPNEIVFTSGGTEADNSAIFGAVQAAYNSDTRRMHVITTLIEHHAVLNAVKALEQRGTAVT